MFEYIKDIFLRSLCKQLKNQLVCKDKKLKPVINSTVIHSKKWYTKLLMKNEYNNKADNNIIYS